MIRALSAIVMLATALAACAAPPQDSFAELTYRHLKPIELNVGAIDIRDRYIPPLKAPNVEHRTPVPPYTAIRRWGEQRLRAMGGVNTARLVVLDASIKENRLSVDHGLKGTFTTQQSERYDGRVAVLLEIRDPRGRQLAFVTARANRSNTVPEGTPIAQRERVWYALTEDMMRDLNSELERNIARFFGPYLARR